MIASVDRVQCSHPQRLTGRCPVLGCGTRHSPLRICGHQGRQQPPRQASFTHLGGDKRSVVQSAQTLEALFQNRQDASKSRLLHGANREIQRHGVPMRKTLHQFPMCRRFEQRGQKHGFDIPGDQPILEDIRQLGFEFFRDIPTDPSQDESPPDLLRAIPAGEAIALVPEQEHQLSVGLSRIDPYGCRKSAQPGNRCGTLGKTVEPKGLSGRCQFDQNLRTGDGGPGNGGPGRQRIRSCRIRSRGLWSHRLGSYGNSQRLSSYGLWSQASSQGLRGHG